MLSYGFLKAVLNCFVQIILPYKLIGKEKVKDGDNSRHIAYKKQAKSLEPQGMAGLDQKNRIGFLCKLTKMIRQCAQNFTWIFVKFVEAGYLNLRLIGV